MLRLARYSLLEPLALVLHNYQHAVSSQAVAAALNLARYARCRSEQGLA